MLRSASSFVTATYNKVGLIPQYSRALPQSFLRSYLVFVGFIILQKISVILA
jgi:hypothetical protein